MKKIISMLCAVLFSFAFLCACGGGANLETAFKDENFTNVTVTITQKEIIGDEEDVSVTTTKRDGNKQCYGYNAESETDYMYMEIDGNTSTTYFYDESNEKWVKSTREIDEEDLEEESSPFSTYGDFKAEDFTSSSGGWFTLKQEAIDALFAAEDSIFEEGMTAEHIKIKVENNKVTLFEIKVTMTEDDVTVTYIIEMAFTNYGTTTVTLPTVEDTDAA